MKRWRILYLALFLVNSLKGEEKDEINSWYKKYPELSWFYRGKIPGPSTIQEVTRASRERFPSEKIFQEKVDLFDRLILSLNTVSLFFEGEYPDYLAYVFSQPKSKRLSWKQLQEIQDKWQTYREQKFNKDKVDIKSVVELLVIYHYLTYTETLKNKAKIYEIEANTPLELEERVATSHPEILPSFTRLNLGEEKLFLDLYPFLNFDALLEDNQEATLLKKLIQEKWIEAKSDYFELALYTYLAIRGGAKGDLVMNSSLTLTYDEYENIIRLQKAAKRYKGEKQFSLLDIYTEEQANALDLNLNSPFHRLILKTMQKLHLYSKEECELIKKGYCSFKAEDLGKVSALIEENKLPSTFQDDIWQRMQTESLDQVIRGFFWQESKK